MKLLNNEGKSIETLELGIVKAGDIKEYTFSIYNDSPRKAIEIEAKAENKEVKIISCPTSLNAEEKGILKLSWNPALDVKQGLKSNIKIVASELYE